MASETRHAAWHNQPRYAVRLLSGPEPAGDLVEGLTEFRDAVDFAWDWLDRVDPARDLATRMAILETRDGVTREVWTYAPDSRRGPQETRERRQSLVEIFGFNPVTWESGVREFSAGEQRTGLRDRLRTAPPAPAPTPAVAPPRPAAPAGPMPSPVASGTVGGTGAAHVRAEAPGQESSATSTHRRIRILTRRVWDDRLSRVCLLASLAWLWLSLVSTDLHFLLPLLATVPILYWRQHSRGKLGPEGDAEGWLF